MDSGIGPTDVSNALRVAVEKVDPGEALVIARLVMSLYQERTELAQKLEKERSGS